jgi:membrane-associated phospholipid phosphatase
LPRRWPFQCSAARRFALFLPFSVVILWLRKLRWQDAELVIATLGVQVANDLLKLVFQRDRPTGYLVVTNIPGQGYSFPSGHAMVSIAFYGALTSIGWRLSLAQGATHIGLTGPAERTSLARLGGAVNVSVGSGPGSVTRDIVTSHGPVAAEVAQAARW